MGKKSMMGILHFLIPPIIITPLLLLCCAETNTLNQSDTLNITGTLVSNNKRFILGFVMPDSFSNNTYLSIWNSYAPPSSAVWLANRNTPITDDSPTLFIHSTGKFIINQTHGNPLQLCPGEETTTTNTKAVLLDNGNLILTEVNPDGFVGRILWQSFDCPTNQLIPGMKLGINHRTGRNWSLTSWLDYTDPSPGAFTLEWDPHGLEIVLKLRGVVFWTSGALRNRSDGGLTFGNKELISKKIQSYKMMYIKTSDEEYFTYSVDEDVAAHISIDWIIDVEGSMWFDGEKVALQDYCYGYKDDMGCAEWEQPWCRSYNKRFQLLSGNFVNKSNGNFIYAITQTLSPADCRLSCWNDCDCQGYLKSTKLVCAKYSQDVVFQPDSSPSAPQYYVIQQQSQNSKFIN